MDILVRLWVQALLFLTGLTIATMDFFGHDTTRLWLEILPEIKVMLGLGS